MDLDEAKNNLKKLIELRKNKCEKIKYDNCICGTKDLEIVLEELESYKKRYELAIKQNISYKQNIKDLKENRIPKNVIREKINERQFELQQEYKDFKDDIRLNTLQEIYYLLEE